MFMKNQLKASFISVENLNDNGSNNIRKRRKIYASSQTQTFNR